MSVLSIRSIEDRLTDDKEEYLKNRSEGDGKGKILIKPSPLPIQDERNIVTIDLHIGEEINYPVDDKVKKQTKSWELRPGQAVNIMTKEYIGLPLDVTALVFSKLSSSIKGLSHVATHVDPGFHGHLVETIANLDQTDIEMEPGNKFCSIMFLEVKEPYGLYEGSYIGQEDMAKICVGMKGVNPSKNGLVNESKMSQAVQKLARKEDLRNEISRDLKTNILRPLALVVSAISWSAGIGSIITGNLASIAFLSIGTYSYWVHRRLGNRI